MDQSPGASVQTFGRKAIQNTFGCLQPGRVKVPGSLFQVPKGMGSLFHPIPGFRILVPRHFSRFHVIGDAEKMSKTLSKSLAPKRPYQA